MQCGNSITTYLANAVIELDKRDNRWRYTLEDKARRFRDAGTWAARFKALLGPWEQVRIAWQATRRRLRYAPHQRFAAYSAVRLALNPWLPLIVVAAMTANWWWTQEQARDLYSSIGHSGSITNTETKALWDMTQSSDAVRRAVVRTALALPGDAVRFTAPLGGFSTTGRRSDYVLQSTVGMDLAQRQAILVEHISGTCGKADLENADQRRACAFAAVHLDAQALVTSKLIMAAMEMTTDSARLRYLGEGLAGLADRLSSEEAAALARRIVGAMEKATDSAQFRYLAEGLAGPGEWLSSEDAAAAARLIVAAMEKTTDSNQLRYLAEGLAGLGERLPAEEAAAVARLIVGAMEKATDFNQLHYLALGLAGPGEWLSSEEAAMMQDLAGLGERLSAGEAAALARRIVGAMEKATDAKFRYLGQGLAGLGGRLPDEEATVVAGQLLKLMPSSRDPQLLALLRLPRLGPIEIEGYSGGLLKLVRLLSCVETLAAFGTRLSAKEAALVVQILLVAISQAVDPAVSSFLSEALPTLGERLSGPQAAAAARRIVGAMEKTTDSNQLRSLAEGLAGLGERLPAEEAATVAWLIVGAMEKATDSAQLRFLAEGLAGVGDRLLSEEATAVVRRIVGAMEKTTDFERLNLLAKGLAGLGGAVGRGGCRGRAADCCVAGKDDRSLSVRLPGLRPGGAGGAAAGRGGCRVRAADCGGDGKGDPL